MPQPRHTTQELLDRLRELLHFHYRGNARLTDEEYSLLEEIETYLMETLNKPAPAPRLSEAQS